MNLSLIVDKSFNQGWYQHFCIAFPMESHRVERLFFKCCRHVLASPSLADLVPHLLPKPIAQYLLLIACDINNLIVVTKLIKSWKFSDISLCHTANALWCRDVAEGYRWLAHDITQFHLPETIVRIHQTSISCVSPSEYHGVFSARDLSDQCVSAVAVGLYEYVMYNMRVAGTVPPLAVDLSGVMINDGQCVCVCPRPTCIHVHVLYVEDLIAMYFH